MVLFNVNTDIFSKETFIDIKSKNLCPSVRPPVRPSVHQKHNTQNKEKCQSICLSVRPSKACTGCSGKIVFFFHNSLQPLSRQHRCKRPSKLSMQCECVQSSYWLVIFCTTNSSRVLARERWQTFENSWKKTQYLINTL